MIPIQELTEKRLKERIATLPLKLQQAIDSETNPQIVAQVCANHHLMDEEKILIVQQLSALVLMGFIHDYDLGREMNEALALNNPQLTASIATEIGTKVFTPVKTELIANFRPLPVALSGSPKPSAPAVPAPTPLVSTRIPTLSPAPSPESRVFAPSAISVTQSVPQSVSPARPSSPAQIPQIAPKPQPAAPAPLPISKITVPVVPAIPFSKPLPNASIVAKPSATPAPPPMLLHRESTATPVQGISFSSSLPADQRIRDAKFDKPAPPKPARIDLGGVPSPRPSSPVPPASPARVVHYSDFTSSAPSPRTTPSAIPSQEKKPLAPVLPSINSSLPSHPQIPAVQKPSIPHATAAFHDTVPATPPHTETPLAAKAPPPKVVPPDRRGFPVPPPPPPPPKSNSASPLGPQMSTASSPVPHAPQEMIDIESLTKTLEHNGTHVANSSPPSPQGTKP